LVLALVLDDHLFIVAVEIDVIIDGFLLLVLEILFLAPGLLLLLERDLFLLPRCLPIAAEIEVTQVGTGRTGITCGRKRSRAATVVASAMDECRSRERTHSNHHQNPCHLGFHDRQSFATAIPLSLRGG
jgi:hypothetical protein